MIELTAEEASSQPDSQWAKEVCRIGQGAGCCRFLTMGPDGWECQKGTSMGVLLTTRAGCGLMHAQSDNCPGRPTRGTRGDIH
jgi:hypothetical protein